MEELKEKYLGEDSRAHEALLVTQAQEAEPGLPTSCCLEPGRAWPKRDIGA